MSRLFPTTRRGFVGLAGAGIAGAALSGCSGMTPTRNEPQATSSGSASASGSATAAAGPIAISMADLPENPPHLKAAYEEAMKAYLADHPDLDIDARPQPSTVEMTQTLPAKVANGSLETGFILPMGSVPVPIANSQAGDITAAFGENPIAADINDQNVAEFDGKIYGFGTKANFFGLVYNGALFEKAGLDPDTPPTSWEEFEEAAAKISALGNGVYGYADLGGPGLAWHYMGWLYSAGGRAQEEKDGKWVSLLSSPEAIATAELYKRLAHESKGLSPKLFQSEQDVGDAIAASQIGMYVGDGSRAASFSAAGGQYGLEIGVVRGAGLPQNGGNGTLAQSSCYLFSPKASEEERKSALDWALFQYYDPKSVEMRFKAAKEAEQPVLPVSQEEFGLKEGSATREAIAELTAQYSDLPAEVLEHYTNEGGKQEMVPEPQYESQQVYALLAPVLEKIITDSSTDVSGELNAVSEQIQQQVYGG